MENIKDLIQKYLELIQLDTAINRPEAEKRASQFLIAQAHLNETLMELREKQMKVVSVLNAVYANEVQRAGGKTITESKMIAEASSAYNTAREEVETLTNNIEYFKTYLKIFAEAHILHRNAGKDNV